MTVASVTGALATGCQDRLELLGNVSPVLRRRTGAGGAAGVLKPEKTQMDLA